MNWSQLSAGVRTAIAAVGCLLVLGLMWAFLVQPARARNVLAGREVATAEAQLESMDREIAAGSPVDDRERSSWQATQQELLVRLGPESELPLLIESLVRLAEAQGVDLFITSEGAQLVAAAAEANQRRAQQPPSRSERVLAGIPGSGFVPLNCRIFGDYVPTSRFLSQLGRLGWVMEISSLKMLRSFPEVATDLQLLVFYRPTESEIDGPGLSQGLAAARGIGSGLLAGGAVEASSGENVDGQ